MTTQGDNLKEIQLQLVVFPTVHSPSSAPLSTGTAITGESFIKAFPRQAGIPRHLGHSLCASNIAQSLGNKCGITFGLSKASFQIGGYFLRCSEMFGNIVSSGDVFFIDDSHPPWL